MSANSSHWIVEQFASDDDEVFVGSFRRGPTTVATFYDPTTRRIVEREVDPDAQVADADALEERVLEAEETLGETIEEVGDTVGWDSLSEFAREHLEDTEAS